MYNDHMTTFTHLAILGRQPELGLIELESLLGSSNITQFGKKASLFHGELEIDQLGGVIKLGQILYQGAAKDLLSVDIDWIALGRGEQKTTFGLSYYGQNKALGAIIATGLELKKRLRTVGPARLVSPTTGSELTAAQYIHNKIHVDGFELLIVVNGNDMVIARTTGVQDIDAYTARDYARPARSATVGMLPPKLAQVLINTTAPGLVVDPFCGTGVVLQEALLKNRSVAGYDLAPEMITATTTNLEWLSKQTIRPLPAWHAEVADARLVMLPDVALSLVSEGYLGPNLMAPPSQEKFAELEAETTALYRATLLNFARQLPSGADLAICLPNWRTERGWKGPSVVDDLLKIGYTTKVFKHVPGPVRYARPDQIVGRQLLFLTRL
jgi:tRNA G10  N-methylase Trm11